ncbi:hypothetical protein C8F01DRAFT_1086871 [Mycena amicta]|nr:hypothetical protein C8F01DRAFT_1086871 [Mycena amicta]
MEHSGFDRHFVLQLKLSHIFRVFLREVNSSVYDSEHPSTELEAIASELARLRADPYTTVSDRAAMKREKRRGYQDRRHVREATEEVKPKSKKRRRKGKGKGKRKKRARLEEEAETDVRMAGPSSEASEWEGGVVTDDTEGMGIADAAEGKTDEDMDMEGVGEDDAQTGCMDEEMKVEEMEGVGEDDAQTGCMDEEMEDASEYHQPKRREIPKPIVASRPSKQAGYDAPPGTSGCKICKNLQPERHCYRFLYCEAQDPELLQALNNCALTEASKGDRLESRKDGERIKWVDPSVLPIHFVTIKKRPDVLQRGCATDTTIMVDRATLQTVGTVVIGVFQPVLLGIIQTNQEEHTVKNVTRRTAMQALSYGTMTSAGVSQVAGGAPLQTYGMSLDAESPEGLTAIFSAAIDSVALGEVARATVPDYRADHDELAETTDMAWLGTQIGTLYYCTTYLSCVHEDDDANPRGEKNAGGLLQPCMQTEKSGCKPGEFDFFFLHWGVRLQTETNVIWQVLSSCIARSNPHFRCFNATQAHASCVPSRSTMDSGQAVSRGQHKSARRKDALAASRRKRAGATFRERQAAFGTPETEEGGDGEEYDADEEE